MDTTLRYRTVPGQDTAPLIAALREAGYDATSSTAEGESEVLVTDPGGGLDREQVRAVLQEANTTSVFDGRQVDRPVTFVGEDDLG
ncbi:MAG: hypothetical protein QOK15_1437 [Nocardioidaceae bacterium]|nr:hypothetical protein [Nocardioidaceae bacterium]